MKVTYNSICICILASVVALVAPSAGDCPPAPADYRDVFANEHIEFEADPANTAEYYYDWSTGSTIMHTPPGDEDIVFAVDAPDITACGATSTQTVVDVLITSSLAPECNAQTCFGLNIWKLCPTDLDDYCTTDSETFCWYDCYGATAPFTPDSSISFEWYINDEAIPIYTGECYVTDFDVDEGYDDPTYTDPVKPQTVTMKVFQETVQAGYPHAPSSKILLYECKLDFNLHWDPAGNIAISSTFP